MGLGKTCRLGVFALAAALGVLFAADAQILSPVRVGQPHRVPNCTGCTVVREIDDPNTGQRWVLMRDPAHPGGPGALVAEESVPDHGWLEGAIVQLHPVIRAGDRLTVEQSNVNVKLTLEGVALSPAAPGAQFRVRLGMSGKVVLAVALGPGRAALVPDKEIWQ